MFYFEGIMKSNLFIPTKIKVGFQERKDTFTGKLAYIIYFDEKGVLRKESSWEGWRDKKIAAIEYDNVPTRYVVNKGVDRYGYFGSGRSIARIYDTRDFEFEISISNLMGILMHSDVSKRDIVEECVYAWSGKDLVLLPVNSTEYQESVEYTKKQSLTLSTKSLVKGHTYVAKKHDTSYLYIGYYNWYYNGYRYSDNININQQHKGKKHVFYNLHNKTFETISMSALAECTSTDIPENFSNIVEQFENSSNYKKIVDFKLIKLDKLEYREKEWQKASQDAVNKQDNDNFHKKYYQDKLENMGEYELYVLGRKFHKKINNNTINVLEFTCYNTQEISYVSSYNYKIVNTDKDFYTENQYRGVHIYPISNRGYGSYYNDAYATIKKLSLDENFFTQEKIMLKDLIDFLFKNGYTNSIEYIDSNNTVVNLV